MSCPAVEILLEIRDLLRDLDTLAERREKNRLRMAAKRAEQTKTSKSEDVCAQNFVRAHKEDGKGKETFPPAPSIEKGEREKKELSLAHAREAGRVIPPSLDDVRAYCTGRHPLVDPVTFWNFYESKGWRIGKNRMKNWHCAIATWERPRACGAAPRPVSVRKADNWRGTKPENMDSVLG